MTLPTGPALACVLLLMAGSFAVTAQTPELDLQRERWRLQEEQRQKKCRRSQELMQRQQKSAEDEKKKIERQYDDERKRREDEHWQKDGAQTSGAGGARRPQRCAVQGVARQAARTPPPFKVRATCSCLGKTQAWRVLTQQSNAYAPRSVAVYAPWFQLPCLQPVRGPL